MSLSHRRAGVIKTAAIALALAAVVVGLSLWTYNRCQIALERRFVAQFLQIPVDSVRKACPPNLYRILRNGGEMKAQVVVRDRSITWVGFQLPHPKSMNWAEATPEERTEAIKNEIHRFFGEPPGVLRCETEKRLHRIFHSSQTGRTYEVGIAPDLGIRHITLHSGSGDLPRGTH